MAPAASSPPTLIVDNGSGSLKLGVPPARGTTANGPAPLIVQNAIAKAPSSAVQPPPSVPGRTRRPQGYLVAAEIERAPDISGLFFRRPHDRGVLTSFDLQRDIWLSAFSADRGLDAPPPVSLRLLLTEHVGVPLAARRGSDALIFEALGFASAATVVPHRLAAHAPLSLHGGGVGTGSMRAPTALVLDSGFSATTAIPIVRGIPQLTAARRLSLGGKALTNLLKRLVSFRSWNMAEETALMAAVKDRACRVAPDYPTALAECRTGPPPVRYVLPEPGRHVDPLGHVAKPDMELAEDDQVLNLRNEVYAVPEALFHPGDIGMEQAGVAEVVSQAASACEEDVQADLYANVILTGGNCLFPGFLDRFEKELRPIVPSHFDVKVRLDEDPICTTYNGALRAVRNEKTKLPFVAKEHYFEAGTDAILREIYGD